MTDTMPVAVPHRIEFRLLGPLEVLSDGSALPLRPLQQRLAGILLLALGAPVPRDVLISQLWDFAHPPDARGTLHVEIRNLRERLEPGTPAAACRVLLTTPRGYAIGAGPDELDLARFLQHHDAGRALLESADHRGALARLREADRLWRGPLLANLDARFARQARERYEPVRVAVRERLCLALLGLGAHEQAKRYLWRALSDSPGSEQLRALMEEVLTRSGRASASSVHDDRTQPWAPAHNLPRYEGQFIGRDAEAEDLASRTRRSRVTTVIGPVGVGKSRLAVHVAWSLAGDFDQGVRHVEVPRAADHAALTQVLLLTVGGRELPGQDLIESLVRQVADRSLLLVLDGCEGALAAVAGLARTLLHRCQHVRLLATSTVRLGTDGEELLRLPPLREVDAIQLFAERAGQQGLLLDTETADAAVAICRRLDGVPLALELAASQLHALSARQLAERLDQRFLELADRTGRAAHHRTLQTAFDASHELLSEPEQVLFRRLGVFDGSFSLECCEASCGYGVIPKERVTGLLVGLIDRSLVVADLGGTSGPRYHLLQMVQLYAQRLLQRAGEPDEVRARCLDWCLALADEARRHMRMPDSRDWLQRIEADYATIRAALSWAIRHRPLEAVRLAQALGHYWDMTGMMSEGRRWLINALATGSGSAQQRALALHEATWLTWRQGRYDEAEAMLVNLDELWAEAGRPVADEVATMRGLVAISRSDFATAEGQLGPVIARIEADAGVRAMASYFLGLARLFSGADLADARARLEESLRLRRDSGYDPVGGAFSIGILANIDVHHDPELAKDHLRTAFAAFNHAGDRVNVLYALEAAARLHAILGNDETAVQIASACGSLRQRLGGSGMPPWDAYWRHAVADAERRLGDRAQAIARSSRSLSLDALCAYAQETLAPSSALGDRRDAAGRT